MRHLPPAVLIALVSFSAAHAETDAAAVRRLLAESYDKPEARLAVDPIVIEGDAAVADWAQGEMVGRAFLRRKDGAWSIALCAGDALKNAGALEKLGVPHAAARALSERLTTAEQRLDAAYLQRMSRFDGMIEVDAAQGGAPADPHHKAPPK